MLKRLLRDTSVYSLSSLLTAGLSLLLLPVYARLLHPREYGALDLVLVVGFFVAVTVALEITQAVMIHFSRSEDAVERARIVSTGFWTMIGCFATFLLVVALTAPVIASILFGDRHGAGLVRLAAGLYFATAVVRYWTVIDRSCFHPWRVLATAVSAALLAGAVSVTAVLAGYGVEGLIAGQLLGQGAVALIATAAHVNFLRIKPASDMFRLLAGFSAPLVLSSAAIVATSYVDRLIVRELLGLEALGIYGFGARIASVMALLLMGFQFALAPLIYSQLEHSGVHQEVAKVFRVFIIIAGAVYLLLFLFAEPVCRLVGGSAYTASATPARLLGAAVLMQGIYIFFPGLMVARRTLTFAAINLAGFVTSLVATLSLVRAFGLTGAGLGALLGASVVALLNYRISQQYFRVPVLRSRT